LQISGAEAFDELLVVGAFRESAAANYGEFFLCAEFYRARETLQARVTFVLDRTV
jgi:hypothetical protein